MKKQDLINVPYGKSVHGEEEIEAVVSVLRSSTQMGKSVREMEQRVAHLFHKTHGIMVNSGSSANYLAIEILQLPINSEVITPVLTLWFTPRISSHTSFIPQFLT